MWTLMVRKQTNYLEKDAIQDTRVRPGQLPWRMSPNLQARDREKKGKDEATGFPVIPMDYEILREKLALPIVKDEGSGSTLAHGCLATGPGDAPVCRQLVQDLGGWTR